MRALILGVLVAGCAPLDGYNCEKLEERRCDGPTKVVYCEPTNLGGKKWKAYDCPSGCAGDKCSWKGVVEREPCPPQQPGGWCDADGYTISCSVSQPRDGGVPTGVWSGYMCAACKKDVPIEQTAVCNNGICDCG